MHLSTSTAYAYKIYFWVPLPKCTKKIIIPSAYLVREPIKKKKKKKNGKIPPLGCPPPPPGDRKCGKFSKKQKKFKKALKTLQSPK